MKGCDPTVRVEDARGDAGLGHALDLFRSCAAEFAGSVAESLCHRGFEAGVTGLPGRYAPPSGCLLLATAGGAPPGAWRCAIWAATPAIGFG
jgi:putative acetyltransferase